MISNFEDHGHYYSDVDPTELMMGKSQKLQKHFKFHSIEDTDIPEQLYDIELPDDLPYVDEQIRTPR